MFFLDLKTWKEVAKEDIQPKNKVFEGEPVYYRTSSEPAIYGQVESGSPVFWQVHVKRYRGVVLDVELEDITFWQELWEERKPYWWGFNSRGLVSVRKNLDGDYVEYRSIVVRGGFDSLNVWCPRYQRVPLIEILHANSFKSLTKTTKHCLAVLLMKANYGGNVIGLSDQEVCDMTGFSKEAVAGHLKELESLKVIQRTDKKKKVRVNGQYQQQYPKNYKIKFGYEKFVFDNVKLYQSNDRKQLLDKYFQSVY